MDDMSSQVPREEPSVRPFSYLQASDEGAAVATVAENPSASFVAGGTEMLNWMKDGIEEPDLLVDVNALPLKDVEARGHSVRIGAMCTMSDVASEPAVREAYPALAEALEAGASPQLRNMATIGGNLLQRTRCPYFRETSFPCNKRSPGSGCSALAGEHRMHAILGASDACVAVQPSDLAVALVALDAVVHTKGADGERTIPIDDFYLLPGSAPERETVLQHGELIVGVEVPGRCATTPSRFGWQSGQSFAPSRRSEVRHEYHIRFGAHRHRRRHRRPDRSRRRAAEGDGCRPLQCRPRA